MADVPSDLAAAAGSSPLCLLDASDRVHAVPDPHVGNAALEGQIETEHNNTKASEDDASEGIEKDKSCVVVLG